jgi:hypothetical protein
MKNKENNIFNYLTLDNGILIQKCSSSDINFPIENSINQKRNELWLSSENVPQEIIFNLKLMRKKPKNILNIFGFYCNYTLQTNPKLIEVLFSNDNKKYFSLGNYLFKYKGGVQLVRLKNLDKIKSKKTNFDVFYNYIKVLIKETYGGFRKCYINNFYLFEDNFNFDLNQFLFKIENELNNNNTFRKFNNYFYNNKSFKKSILKDIENENENEINKMNQNELKLFEKEFNSEKKIKRENEEITILKKIEKVLKNKNMNNFNQNYDKFQNIINENIIENYDIFKNKKNQNQNVKNENEKKEEFKKIKFLQTKNELNSISNENENNNEWDNIMYKINNLTNTIQNCFNSNNIILINKNNNEKQIINKISNQNKENQNDDFTKDLYSILIEKTNKLNKIKQKLLLEKN